MTKLYSTLANIYHEMYQHVGKASEFDDITTLRTFTKDEIQLFLKLAGFTVKEIMEEPKTLTVIAEKNGK